MKLFVALLALVACANAAAVGEAIGEYIEMGVKISIIFQYVNPIR